MENGEDHLRRSLSDYLRKSRARLSPTHNARQLEICRLCEPTTSTTSFATIHNRQDGESYYFISVKRIHVMGEAWKEEQLEC